MRLGLLSDCPADSSTRIAVVLQIIFGNAGTAVDLHNADTIANSMHESSPKCLYIVSVTSRQFKTMVQNAQGFSFLDSQHI